WGAAGCSGCRRRHPPRGFLPGGGHPGGERHGTAGLRQGRRSRAEPGHGGAAPPGGGRARRAAGGAAGAAAARRPGRGRPRGAAARGGGGRTTPQAVVGAGRRRLARGTRGRRRGPRHRRLARPWAARGAPWFDAASLLVNIRSYGDLDVAPLLPRILDLGAAREDVLGVAAGLAGLLAEASRRPPAPGLPTLRAFQRNQEEA